METTEPRSTPVNKTEIDESTVRDKLNKEKPKSKKESQELANLRKELANKEQLYKESQEKILYVRAEFENYKKRIERDQAGIAAYAKEHVILSILPVLDSFDRAAASYENTHSAEDILKGFQLIHKQFLDTLARLNVSVIDCKGHQFDPTCHDAMLHQQTADAPENTIIEVCQPGYKFQDKIIRHAQVIIAKQPEIKEEEVVKNKE